MCTGPNLVSRFSLTEITNLELFFTGYSISNTKILLQHYLTIAKTKTT